MVRPRYLVWENVTGAYSSNRGRDFHAVLEEIARIAEPGFSLSGLPDKWKWTKAGAIDGDGWSISWRTHDAKDWGKTIRDSRTGNIIRLGTPQRRRRISVVADFGGETAAQIQFERESVSGHPAESGAAGEGPAGASESGANPAVADVSTYCLQGNGIDRADTAGCNGKGWKADESYTLNTIDRPAVCAVVSCMTPWDAQSQRVYDGDGVSPRPRENGFVIDDMQKVNSAYTKKNPAAFIEKSEVLYADKKRTVPLLRLAGLTITSQQLLRNGSMGSITYRGQNVKIDGAPFSDVVFGDEVSGRKFSLKGMDSAYMEAVERGDTGAAQKMVEDAAKAAGYTIKAYHGTARADRVGTVFLPERATSGPMAFFTDNKGIAENYARDKADTSLAYDEEYADYYTQFRVNRNGKSLSVGELWYKLSPSERAKIKNTAPHIRFDEDYDQIIYDSSAQHGNGAYDAYELNRNKGNVLNTLVSTWLETGDLYNREADFLDVLKLAGVTDAKYMDPDARSEKVYEAYLKIQNPFDTGTVGQAFYDGLSAWLEETDISAYRKESAGADMWDKNSIDPDDFLERVASDIEAGTSHVWTSIPDYVTAYLKELGHDGIKDTGGKGGGENHTVWIPFSSEQVKSAEAVTYDNNGKVVPISERFSESSPDIRYQMRGTAEVEREARELKKERNALAKQNEALKQRVQELKGEMRISKEPSVVLRDVKRLGQETIRRYGSDVKYTDVQADMEALGKAVIKKDVSMSDLMPYARSVAEKIVDNTAELTENGAELLEIRDYLKRQKLLFNGEMDHYNEFRKQHMGTMKLNKTEGTPVDTIYAEMTEMFGEGYFPSDVYTDADKLYRIADVLGGMDAIYQNPFAGYRDAAVQEIANDIIDGMISDQVRQKKTFADRRALEKQEAVGRVREMLQKEREKRKGQIKQLRKAYSEKTQKGREKRYATEMRARIARHTGAISEKLLRPTDKQHIPEELRVAVANLLKSINLESAYSFDENGRLRKNTDGNPTKRTAHAEKLRRLYEGIIDSEGEMVVDPALTEGGGLLASLSELGDKRIADMSVTELETVWNAIRAIENTLTSYNRTQANEKYAHISEWAEELAAESMSRRRKNRKLSLDVADPYTYFSAYGKAGMQIYRTLRNAQDREHVMLVDVRDSAKRFLDADVYKNRDERHTFTTGSGAQLTMTTGQIMNLYNLAKRGEQAINHLTNGGIVQPEVKRSKKLKGIDRGTENIQLTVKDIEAITSVLTPEQIKVADGLQKLASTKLAEWGNEASMTVYGYRKFKEEHYWPIKAARDAVSATVEKDADNARSIKNMGSAKALTPNASNALDIGDVYDVFAQNASDMIKYATLLAPMEDINRLYNYRYRDSMGNLTGRNVQQILSSVYGDSARKYWRNLMRDVQNGMVKNASETTKAVERIVGNTKGAAVGANLRVVIQQPTAYFRAAVALDPEHMVKGITKGATAGNGWDKARRWAPIAGIKDTSGFDQGSRYTIAREVYGTDGGALEWLNDKSMALAGKADAVTWGKIWNACEWQVASETNLEVGSDEYYRRVAEVFTDVIDQSQVVDGIMQRTQIMRDSDALTRQATSFMGEPLKSLNMFMRAYDAWAYENNPQKRSLALKKLKRSVAALAVTDVVNALAQSIVDGLRDDDKDKNWAKRILEAFTGYSGDEEDAGEVVKNVVLGGNLTSNMNPVGRIPYLKDILSILQGYTVDRMDAAAADDIIRTSKTFIKGLNGGAKTTTAYNLKQVMLMCSKVLGISVGNMGRDMWAIARSIANDTGNVRMMFEMEKAIYKMDKSAGNRKRWCELLYRAQKDNDTETARLIYKEMLEHGYEEKDVRQGVETIMKKEQGVGSVDDLKNRWRAP